MSDEPLIVRVVCSGPLLGSRTVTLAWFISAADVQAAWSKRTDQAREGRSDRAGATNGAERQSGGECTDREAVQRRTAMKGGAG
jgi:hypothetical protein